MHKDFEMLKKRLVKAPILRFPYWSKKFHAHIDASTIAVGAILIQLGDDNMDHPNAYTSRKINKYEKNYLTIEQEGTGMIFALQIFWHYLLDNPFISYTNHQTLKYLVNKPLHQGRIC